MGSAMNDTTRELGTTLGVAVLGSLLSSGFASRFDSTAAALPEDVRHVAESSLAGARIVSDEIGGSQGEALFNAAKDAWVHGLQLSMTVGAVIILGAAVLVWRLLPAGPATPVDADANTFDVATASSISTPSSLRSSRSRSPGADGHPPPPLRLSAQTGPVRPIWSDRPRFACASTSGADTFPPPTHPGSHRARLRRAAHHPRRTTHDADRLLVGQGRHRHHRRRRLLGARNLDPLRARRRRRRPAPRARDPRPGGTGTQRLVRVRRSAASGRRPRDRARQHDPLDPARTVADPPPLAALGRARPLDDGERHRVRRRRRPRTDTDRLSAGRMPSSRSARREPAVCWSLARATSRCARAQSLGERPDGIVLIEESGRGLSAADITRALRAPIVAKIAYDPRIGRATDRGLLAGKLPRSIHKLPQRVA